MAKAYLYDFKFVYNNTGNPQTETSYYTGTVAEHRGTYFSGETFNLGLGTYYVESHAGRTHEPPGTVTVGAYYDYTSNPSLDAPYTPLSPVVGFSGLGSESGFIYGNEGYQQFGWSAGTDHEANEGNMLYGYLFVYNDGSYYGGQVSSNSTTYNYYVGESINTGYGTYNVDGNDGYTSEPSGTVMTTGNFYYAPGAATYPVLFTSTPDGTSGLGSEFNAFTTSGLAYGFGLDGKYEL